MRKESQDGAVGILLCATKELQTGLGTAASRGPTATYLGKPGNLLAIETAPTREQAIASQTNTSSC
jgi:hypothetical protein